MSGKSNLPAGPPASPPPYAPSWTRRIGTRLTALVAITTFGAFSLSVYLALKSQERNMITQAIEGAALFGDSITRATHDQMLRARKDEAYQVIKEIGSLERIESVRLFNSEGTITFSTDPKEIGNTAAVGTALCSSCHGSGRPLTAPKQPDRARVFRAGDHRVLGLVTPIYNEPACAGAGCHPGPANQRVLGVVDVGVSLASMDHEIAAMRQKTLGAGLAVTAVLMALILHSARRFIVKPVKALVRATREIAAGELDKPIRPHAADELGILAVSFDGMRLSLKDARAKIEDLMNGLERTVEDRTAALKQAQAQLIQGEKLASLGKLSASIAHEINNPLAGILTFAKLIVRDLEQEPVAASVREEALSRLKLVQRETERCSAIVRHLLDFARQRPPDLRDTDVRAVLEESLHLVAHQAEMQGVTLDNGFEGNPMVRADFGQLRQAFVNVLVNAVEATDRGGTIRVRSEASPEAREVVVVISDTGSGIDEQHLSRIFDPFFTTKDKGTGLGLSVVYGIIENLGGKFEVHSRVGEGTIVRIRLPLVPSGARVA
jgi:two-component system, NtrC family, sensor kinase